MVADPPDGPDVARPVEEPPRRRSAGRGTAALLILVGAALIAFAATRAWWTASYQDTPVGPYRTSATGSDTVPELIPVALVAIAGWGAALATRGVWRRIIGGLVAVVGALVLVRVAVQWGSPPLDTLGRTPFVIGVPVDPVRQPWPMVLAAIGGLLVLLGGILLIAGSGRARALSGRYDRSPVAGPAAGPSAADRPVAEDELWKALDAGLDPTGEPNGVVEPFADEGKDVSRTMSERPRADDYDDPATGIAGSGPELSNGRGNRRRPHR